MGESLFYELPDNGSVPSYSMVSVMVCRHVCTHLEPQLIINLSQWFY